MIMASNPDFWSFLVDYVFILLFCLMGAVTKDTFNTISSREEGVKIKRIIISTIVSSIVLFSISDILIQKMTLKIFTLPCFVGGMLGFEIMEKIQNLDFWINTLQNIIDHRTEIRDILRDNNTNERDETTEEDEQ